MLNTLIRLAINHARAVLIISAILTVAGIWFDGSVFSRLSKDTEIAAEHSESVAVFDEINKKFSGKSNDALLLYSSKDGTLVTDQVYVAEVNRLNKTLVTESLQTYYTTGEPSLISQDKTKTIVALSLKSGTDEQKYAQLSEFKASTQSDLLDVRVGGNLVASQDVNKRIEHDLVMAEIISLPILAILLLFIFRSVIAAALPLLLGILSIIGGLMMVGILTHVTTIEQYALNIIIFLGLGLSIDYSLLIIARFREEFKEGVSAKNAVRRTMDHAGKTILTSGLTVMASLLCLTVFPVSLLKSIGYGGSSALLVALLCALTVLPALLVVVGKHINKWPVRLPQILGSQDNKSRSNTWHRLGTFVMKWPTIISFVVIGFVIITASPILGIKFKPVDYTTLPKSSDSHIIGEAMANDFDSQKPSIQVLYNPEQLLLSTEGLSAAYDFAHSLKTIDDVTAVKSLVTANDQLDKQKYQYLYATSSVPNTLKDFEQQTVADNTMLISLQYSGEPSSGSTHRIVEHIRAMRPTGATIQVGGQPAMHYDLVQSITQRLPYAIAIIAIAMFVVLALSLRSIIIPLSAIVINTFALLTTFGILVWIFQEGHLIGDTWLLVTGGLDVTVPILIFAIAFGLSMDYAVFLYSRIHEEYIRTKNTNTSILRGLELTGSLITQAAVLFIVVVVAFATSGIALLQQIGIGLALAVLLDAFIVRVVFVPAVMKLFGKSNWWFPRLSNKKH